MAPTALQECAKGGPTEQQGAKAAGQEYGAESYEELLATAVLNKVLEKCDADPHLAERNNNDNNDTDSGMSGSAQTPPRREDCHSPTGQHTKTSIPCSSDSEGRGGTSPSLPRHCWVISPDQGVDLCADLSSSDATNGCSSQELQQDDSNCLTDEGDGPPIQFKIEEHIEEITTHHFPPDSASHSDSDEESSCDSGEQGAGGGGNMGRAGKRGGAWHKERQQDQRAQTVILKGDALPSLPHLPPINTMHPHRVAFPEMGADLLHCYAGSDEDAVNQMRPGDIIIEPETWEENWLFRRQKITCHGVTNRHEQVAMLIPEGDGHVTVGERDIDELSELSERTSVSSSSELWCLTDSEPEDAVADEDRQDRTLEGVNSSHEHPVRPLVASNRKEIGYDTSEKNRSLRITTQTNAVKRTSSSSSVSKSATPITNSSSVTLQKHSKQNHKTSNNNKSDNEFEINEMEQDTRSENSSSNHNASVKASSRRGLEHVDRRCGNHPDEDVSILSPPSSVPTESDAPSNSPSVWFTEVPEDVVVSTGRALRLSCKVNARVPVGVSWYHNGTLLRSRRTLRSWRAGTSHHMHLFVGEARSAGLYSVAAYTATHCVWAACRVRCKASTRAPRPPQMVRALRRVTPSAEDSVDTDQLVLECQVAGHPEPVVCFTGGAEELVHSSSCHIESDQYGTWLVRLRGSAAGSRDDSVYTATARNQLGIVTSTWDGTLQGDGGKENKDTPQSRGSSNGNLSKGGPERGTSRRATPRVRCTKNTPTGGEADQTREGEDANEAAIFIADPQPGTIAEREHRKWQTAPALQHNPYSAQNLSRRLATSTASLHHTPHCREVSDVEGGPLSCDEDVRSSSKRDLTRYGRDYYVASTAPKRTPSWLSKHDKPEITVQAASNSNEESSDNNNKTKKGPYSLEGSTSATYYCSGGVQVPEALDSSASADWRVECSTSIQPAYVEREVSRLQRHINAARCVYRPLGGRLRNRRAPLRRHLAYSSHEALNAAPACSRLWRTASVDEGLQSCPETITDFFSLNRKKLSIKEAKSTQKRNTNYKEDRSIRNSGSNYYSSSENVCNISVGGSTNNDTSNYQISQSATESKYNIISNKKKIYSQILLTPNINLNSSNSTSCQENDTSLAAQPILSRCASVDNFYSAVTIGSQSTSSESYQPQSIGCFSDCNLLSDAVETPTANSNLYNSRRWQSEANDVNNATDTMSLKLPSVKVLASKFDSLRCQKNKTTKSGSVINVKRKSSTHKIDETKQHKLDTTFGAGTPERNGRSRQGRDAVTNDQNQDQKPKAYRMKEVHSLTARSVPRYFREGLKNNRPQQPYRNILIAPFRETRSGSETDYTHKTAVHSMSSNGDHSSTADDLNNKEQKKLSSIPQETTPTYHTPMESMYYNFTNQQSLPEFVNTSIYTKESFLDANNFTKLYCSNEPKSLSHLPNNYISVQSNQSNGTSTVTCVSPQNDHVTVTYNNSSNNDSNNSSGITTNTLNGNHNINNLTNYNQNYSTTTMINSSESSYTTSTASSLRQSSCSNNMVARDSSPDHLGIPGSRATLQPGGYHRSAHQHIVSGDTSDESSTSTASPPRYSRRPVRSNSAAGHSTPSMRCK